MSPKMVITMEIAARGVGESRLQGYSVIFYLMVWNVSPWMLARPGWCHLWVEHSFVKFYLIFVFFLILGGSYYEIYVDIIVIAYGIFSNM